MPAKRNPAIGGLHSEGIVDDIIIPIAKKVLKGKTKEKFVTNAIKKASKGAAKGGNKYDKAVERKAQGKILDLGGKKDMSPFLDSRQIRKQLHKNFYNAELGHALRTGESTKGLKKRTKKDVKNTPTRNPNLFKSK